MLWTMAAIAAVIAALAAAALAVLRKKASRRDRTIGWNAGTIATGAEGDAAHGFYGLPPHDAARFQRLAREQMHRQQAEWSRDYLPSVTGGARPGRLSGIPRALRVRR
jgi:hypothetical protein